jgi:hypothetical protein
MQYSKLAIFILVKSGCYIMYMSHICRLIIVIYLSFVSQESTCVLRTKINQRLKMVSTGNPTSLNFEISHMAIYSTIAYGSSR